MGEVKNAFVKSKMNKDLDSRLMPSGEYRNAINAQVSKSEGQDVGALENVLGNINAGSIASISAGYICIGYFVDNASNSAFLFYTDNDGDAYVPSGTGSNHGIYQYNATNNSSQLLCSGNFLNFSKKYPITGVNLLENLLFWTDNRNQPRKINISNTIGYYTTEDHISAAKFNPFRAITLYDESTLSIGDYETTMKDVVSKFMPDGGIAIVTADVVASPDIIISDLSIQFYPQEPTVGMTVGYIDSTGILTDTGETVQAWVSGTNTVTLTGPVTISEDDELIFNFNPYYNPSYAGNSTFLEDKFVRFSYRFKFDDGEYSLMAPFTQSCFIPKQDGYFLNQELLVSDQQSAFESTIVEFMENKVNSIDLNIPLPFNADELYSALKIIEIDILYKESDGLAVNVVESVPIADIQTAGSSPEYVYRYINKKPYKTLPEKELIRVYDKIPVKALSQEVISNRIVYGNFQDKHTPPASLDYNVAIGEKRAFTIASGEEGVGAPTSGLTGVYTFTVTWVSGTIGINRNITGPGISETASIVSLTNPNPQPGDAFDITVDRLVDVFSGSALSIPSIGPDSDYTSSIEYPSHSLKTNRTYQVGIVLSDRFGRSSTVILSNNKDIVSVGNQSYSGSTVYSPYFDEGLNQATWLGNSLRILFNSPIAPAANNVSTGYPGLYNGDKSSLSYNPLGWYSYKVVVKQTEQEYYNVYTSGALRGDLSGDNTQISYTTLINDNINKVPRDLNEVGPQDKTFRSSVRLFGRVNNLDTDTGNYPSGSFGFSNTGNQQFYPNKKSFTTTNIQELLELFPNDARTLPVTQTEPIFMFYENSSDPLTATVSTSQLSRLQFGQLAGSNPYQTIENLAIYETEPVESRLDIFWETSTSGIIDELNTIIGNSNSNLVTGFSDWNTLLFNEAIEVGENVLASDFQPVDSFGTNIPAAEITSLTLDSVYDRQSTPQLVGGTGATNPYFILVEQTPGTHIYNIEVTQEFLNNIYFGANASVRQFDFSFTLVTNDGAGNNNPPVIITQEALLLNVCPAIYEADGVTPIVSNTIDLGRIPISQSPILTVTGKNGANIIPPANQNTGKDLTWAITNQTGSVTGTVNYFTVSYSNTALLSTCQVLNTSGNTTVEDYTIELTVTDAGGCTDTLTITFEVGTVPNTVIQREFRYRCCCTETVDDVYPAVLFEITDQNDPNLDGWYFWEYDWNSLVTSQDDGNGNIAIDRTNAADDTNNPCGPATNPGFFYASTYGWAYNLFFNCVVCQTLGLKGTTTTVIDTTGYNFYIV